MHNQLCVAVFIFCQKWNFALHLLDLYFTGAWV